MTTLKEFRDDYYTLSGMASDVARKLGFAAIAIIWIFKIDASSNSYAIASELYCAGAAVILSLALDLLQYIFGAAIWGAFWRAKEKSGVKDDVTIEAPSCFNWPAIFCFWAKLLLMITAYGFLLAFLFKHVAIQ